VSAHVDAAPAVPWTALGPDEAPAVVFVHATRLTRALWWPQLRRLSGRYRCVAVDLPGHGTRHGEPFTIEAAARGVVDAIEAAVPSGRAVVVGLSLGGYVAIEAAELAPDRVAGLVLAGCSAEPAGPGSWPFRVLATILERAPADVLRELNDAFFRLRYPARIADPIIAGGYEFAGGAQALRTLAGRRFLDRLGRLWTPVLVVNGALDPVFGPGGDGWAAACRRGRHAPIARAMHLSSLDRPRAFSRLVAAFVDEASARP
jgi:pimeloyl-ACP methyl ester carboxylesterase